MSGLRKVYPDHLKACVTCRGRGMITCHVCDGRKYSEVIRSWTDDNGRYQSEREREACTFCGASGEVRCGQCGTGNSRIYGGGASTEEGVTGVNASFAGRMAQVEIDKNNLTDWMTANNVNPPMRDGTSGLLDLIRGAEEYGGSSINAIVQEPLKEVLERLGGIDAIRDHGSPKATLVMLIMTYLYSIEALESADSAGKGG